MGGGTAHGGACGKEVQAWARPRRSVRLHARACARRTALSCVRRSCECEARRGETHAEPPHRGGRGKSAEGGGMDRGQR